MMLLHFDKKKKKNKFNQKSNWKLFMYFLVMILRRQGYKAYKMVFNKITVI